MRPALILEADAENEVGRIVYAAKHVDFPFMYLEILKRSGHVLPIIAP